MYATYTYRAGSLAANILADIILMLTGTTNPALLSVDCVVGSTTITSTEAAGWTVYDAAAGTNAQCVRAPLSDDAAQFKYVVVDTNTAGYVFMKLYESWNAVAHTGTNLSYLTDSTSYAQRLNVGAGGRLDIRATERMIAMFSLQAGAYGGSSNNCPQGIFERTRLSGWDTIAAGYPKVVAMPSIWLAGTTPAPTTPRTVNDVGIDVTSSTATLKIIYTPFGLCYAGSVGHQGAPNSLTPNAAKVATPALMEFAVSDELRGDLGGVISGLCKVYFTVYSYGVVYDTISLGADTYIVWTCGAYRLALRVG